jgi:hypothetical protein
MRVGHYDLIWILGISENCQLPKTSCVVEAISRITTLALVHGPIKAFRAYCSLDNLGSASAPRRFELQCSGVSLIDTPHQGRKDGEYS